MTNKEFTNKLKELDKKRLELSQNKPHIPVFTRIIFEYDDKTIDDKVYDGYLSNQDMYYYYVSCDDDEYGEYHSIPKYHIKLIEDIPARKVTHIVISNWGE